MCELVTSMQQSSWQATANLYKDALTTKANKLRPDKKKQLIELDAWKNKSFKPKSRPQTMFSDIKTLKAIASRTMYSGGKVSTKQKPPSVSAQFQWSLMRLMATLNQANPFFIRCIKSNAEKQPCTFNEVLVLRQLRYTGMLATVRIRQSGYNYRLTFEEFTQLYKILLPKGLESEKTDVKSFLESMHMDSDNFQIGKTKVFLREGEKLYLDECLHRAIMARVICIQRWVKTKVERKNFLLMRENAIILQKHIRVFLAQRRVLQMQEAVYLIQRWYRGSRVRLKYNLVRQSAIKIQSHVKGHLSRKRFQNNLPEAICSRKEKHITHEELCKLMTWKLTRGKFRPRLTELVKVNSESEVEEASKKAFKKLPNVQNAIKELIVLKAVGPATASAILAAGAPNHAAFMADESMLAIGGLQPIKYDLPFYMNYMGEVKSLVKQLNEQDSEKSWTPHKVELVLWTYQILQTLAPEKLRKIKTVSEKGDSVGNVGKKDKVLKESKGDNADDKESEPPKKKKRKT